MSVPTPPPAPRPSRRSRRKAPARPRRVFSMPLAMALVLLALTGAAFLVPREGELLRRLEEDGKYGRLLELTLGEGVDPAGLDARKFGELLDEAAEAQWADARVSALIAVLSVSPSVESLLPELDRRLAEVPPEKQVILRRAAAERALAVSRPETAATLYLAMAEAPQLTLEDLRLGLSAHRYCGRVREAFDYCGKYLAAHGLTLAELPKDLRHLMVSLHREANDSGAAFEMLREEAGGDLAHESAELFDLMAATAAESLKTADAIPLLMKYLEDLECHGLDWRQLLERRASLLTRPDTATYRKRAAVVASQLAWNNRVPEAFGLWLRLAALGDEAALERCVQTYQWAGRPGDLTELLAAVQPTRHRFLRGKLAAALGRTGEAEQCFRELAADPREGTADVWETLGHFLDDWGRIEEAADAYRVAGEKDAARLSRVSIARAPLLVALGRPEEALACFQAMPDAGHTYGSLDNYGLLAEALRSDDDLIRAYRLQAAREGSAERFIELADACQKAGRPDEGLEVLEEAREKHPGSVLLSLTLADHLAKAGQGSDAIDLLMASHREGDGRFLSRVTRLAPQAADPAPVLAWIEAHEAEAHCTDEERLEIAELTEELGQLEKAAALYARIPGHEREGDRLRADLRSQSGDYAGALALEEGYLRWKGDRATHHDWTALGDLYQANGRAAEARTAYLRALDLAKREKLASAR